MVTHHYEQMRWVSYLFIGGAINAVVLQVYINFILEKTQVLAPDTQLDDATLATIMGIFPLVFVTPIGLSVLLSHWHPQRRIVPALFMQIIAVGWILLFGYDQWLSTGMLAVIYFFSLYYILGAGMFQDRIVTYLIGYSIEERSMYQYSLRLYCNLDKIKEILMSDRVRQRLGLSTKYATINEYLVIKTRRGHYIIMLGIKPDSQRTNTCLFNFASFERGRYTIKATDIVDEFSKEKLAYLKDVFDREENLVQHEEAPVTVGKAFFSLVKDEMMGLSVRLHEMETSDWVRLGLLVGMFGILAGVFFFVVKFDVGAWLTIAGIIAYLGIEVPSRLRRKFG